MFQQFKNIFPNASLNIRSITESVGYIIKIHVIKIFLKKTNNYKKKDLTIMIGIVESKG